MGFPLLAGSRQPFPGIALIFVRQKIRGIKRHAGMQMSNMFFNATLAGIAIQIFVSFQAVALTDIVRQLLNQNRGIAFAVILNRTADIADIELLLGGHQGFKEQIAVVIATATVAALRLLTHQVKAQRRKRARINTVVHPQQADHLERNRTHRHQGANINRPGEKALADTLLIEAQGQLIAQQ